MSLTCYTDDDLVIRVPVTFAAGSEVTSLSGGTVEAVAVPVGGGTAIPASSATIVGADLIRAVWNDGLFVAAVYDLQIRATVAGQTRTLVAQRLTVRGSVG